MTRIAYVCADRGVRAFGDRGSSLHVQEVVRGLLRSGAAVELFIRRRGGDPPADLAEVPVHRLPKPPKGEIVDRERADLECNGTLSAMLRAAGPFDLVYERHSLWGFAGMEYALETGVPGLLEVNAPLLDEQKRYRVLTLEREAAAAVARAYASARAVLAVSEAVARYVRRHPAVRGEVEVVPNGVDPDRFPETQTPSRPGPAACLTVGFVGTLKPWHGTETLIDAFARLHESRPSARLLIVGDGPEREALETRAEERGIAGATEFHGAAAPTEIPGLLASMDVAVAPYPPLDDFYFSPLKLYEYMAAGRAIVAADIGQIGEAITHETSGLLYPAGDVEALASALGRLEADPGLRTRLGVAARRAAGFEHSWRAVVRRILEIGRCAPPLIATPEQER